MEKLMRCLRLRRILRLCAVAALPLLPQPVVAQQPLIDVHMHLIGGRQQPDFDGAVAAAIALMDRAGIPQAVTLPPPQPQRDGLFDYPDFRAAIGRYPGRFVFAAGGGILNPLIHAHPEAADVTEAVRRDFSEKAEAILAAGAVAFGEMAGLHLSAQPRHPYERVEVDHPLFLLLADIAARRGVPIDLHMDTVVGERPLPARFDNGNNPATLRDTVAALERLLRHNRRAAIVWAHGGSDPLGQLTPALIRRLMAAHPNLHMSLRVVPVRHPVMTNKVFDAEDVLNPDWAALLTDFSDRFVIGTDNFLLSPQMTSGPATMFARGNRPRIAATRRMLSLLPPAVAEKIAAGNARRLYKLAR